MKLGGIVRYMHDGCGTSVNYLHTLKKQIGCFNHRVVTLVAILSGLHKVSFGI